MSYRLYTVRIFTRDWLKARAFYRDTLGMVEKYASEDIGWAEFDAGSASLALERTAADDSEADDLVGRFAGISLAVENIAGTYESLVEKGVEFLNPPARQPWGGVLAHFKDPDGNIITLLGEPGEP